MTATLSDPQFWKAFGQIVFLNLLLSGDNALVIAMATRSLPPRQQKWGRVIGAAGAVGLRIVFVLLLAKLLDWPYLQFVGGLALIFIAIKLIRPAEEEAGKVKQGTSLMEAVLVVIMADLFLSLDNVLAISAAAKGKPHGPLLVTLGLALSIPLVIWGSELLSVLMKKFRWIVWLGGAVLGHVAVDLLLKDECMLRWLGDASLHTAAHYLPWGIGALLFALGWWFARNIPANSEVAGS